ncbi:unknown [Mycoplasma sp. CAG:472]|nr:unknown [Mycoplasma sp. CAG:472]
MEEKSVNNGVYLTFISEPEIEMPNKLNVFREKGIASSQTEFTKFLYGENNSYSTTYEQISRKQSIDNIKPYNLKNYYGIRTILKTDGLMSKLIRQNATLISNDEVVLGSYPTKIVADDTLIKSLKKLGFNDKVYNVPIGEDITSCQTVTFNDEDYIYIKGKDIFVKINPLVWYYDEASNSLISKDVICAFYTSIGINDFQKYGYNFLNEYLIRDIFKNNVISLTKPVNLIVEKDSSEMYLPYDYDIDIDSEGKLYSHDENEYNINIDEKIDLTSFNALEYTFKNSYKHNPIFNITIKGNNKIAYSHALDFVSLGINARISNIVIDVNNLVVNHPVICAGSYIDNANIRCDLNQFATLYLSGDVIGHNILKGSNLTINYTSETEVYAFLIDIKKLVNVLKKNALKYKQIYFDYKKVVYECVFLKEEDYNFYDNNLFKQIGLATLTLNGPEINKEKVEKIIGNDENIFYTFEDKTLKEIPNDSSLSKEATHILDLAKEIISIDYIGIDKENIREKVDEIIDEYNNLYSKETKGLALSTNSALYTNTVIKLENLRDTLYHNFEKNVDYYDILDLISSLIKKLNDEEVELNYEILNDINTLNIILKYSEDNQTKIEIITYLESERKSITDYLCNKKEIDYKNINDFIKKFRIFLVPILTKVSGNVSKIDVMEQIKNYAINEMNNKSLENKNNYIRVILTEINNVKEDILKLDNSYTFEEIDFSSFNTGNEIIDYLDSLFIKYYGIYLRLYDETQKQNVYKKNLIPKIY